MWNNTVATLMIAKPQRQCLNIAIDKVGEQEPRPWHKTRGKEQAEEEAIGADSEVEVRVAGGEKKKPTLQDSVLASFYATLSRNSKWVASLSASEFDDDDDDGAWW
ncbi:hypothetical protein HKD37_03G008647 [Glycine soja]